MRLRSAAMGSTLFFTLAPGVVAGLIPWWMTDWDVRDPAPYAWPVQATGGLLVAAGLTVLLQAFIRFVVEGRGTPAPVAPTERLVVQGLYRYIRNPMYVAVVATILGQAILFGRLALLWYALAAAAAMAAFAHWHEEPALLHTFGDDYDEYRRAVPAWWPRGRAWRPEERD